jgi:UDP-N-acetylmuramate: L-alanyl-gamma-D-glutamyl-meso-diaminopimelate ligase
MAKYHFIGMCGKAMGTLAVMIQNTGNTVTGSDEGFYEPMLSYLQKNNINFYTGHSASNIPHDVDCIVIGKHAKLTPDKNPEVAEAFLNYKDKVFSLPEIMHDLTKDTNNIICIGSFGKSTMTTLVSFILEHSGKNPSYFIGGVPIDMPDSGKIGSGNNFVIEGDEYPSSNWDSQAKFMHYNASDIILTSCEHDHINVYPTLESYAKPFQDLAKTLKDGSLFVYAKDGAHIEKSIIPLLGDSIKIISYGIENATYTARNIVWSEKTQFDLCKNNEKVVTITTNLLGTHNIENILGASAMVLEKELVTPDELANAVQSFHGVKGRLDRKTTNSHIPIYESYGSSYSKARADLDAIIKHFATKKIIDIFEPHTFGWRNRGNLDWYNDVFTGVQVLYIFEPPTHGASTHEQITRGEMIEQIKEHNKDMTIREVSGRDDVYKYLKEDITNDSLIVLTTSGALDELPILLPKDIENII